MDRPTYSSEVSVIEQIGQIMVLRVWDHTYMVSGPPTSDLRVAQPT